MSLYLGLLLFSFAVNSFLIVPFINILYRIRFTRRHQQTKDFLGNRTKIFDRLHERKAGTPVGGGALVIATVSILYALIFPLIDYFGVYIHASHSLNQELQVIFLTFISFGLLGLYDDFYKFFGYEKKGFFGLRMREKLIIQIILAVIISLLLYQNLGIDFIHIPSFGEVRLGWWYVPLSAIIIIGFANAYNITDGLDGLSTGLLMICLFALWILSATVLDTALSVFISLWLGGLLAFLYFNVFPARIMLGDVGALSFGATLAVTGLLTGKIIAVTVIGAIYVLEAASSLIQMVSKKFLHRKVFAVAPFHLWLQHKQWEEPKVVIRAWLAQVVLAIFGLWLAML